VRQRIEFEETIISGDWAFDRAAVYTTITPRYGSATNTFASRTFTILRREASGEWRVARAMGVIEQ
jgi:ketosteroid isomerase-like protein